MSRQPSISRTVDADYRRVLRSAGADMRRVLFFIRCTGVRVGELISLRWGEIDWQRSTATLFPAFPATLATRRRLRRKCRTIVLGPDALRLLRWLHRRRRADRYVFTDALGARWTRHRVYRRLGRITRRLGFPAVLLLRDRFIAKCISPIGSVSHVAQVLGHSTVKFARDYVRVATTRHSKASQRTATPDKTAQSMDNNGERS